MTDVVGSPTTRPAQCDATPAGTAVPDDARRSGGGPPGPAGRPAADQTLSGAPRRVPTKVRTAVVVVHGMGEQLPLETLDRFVHAALRSTNGRRTYFSRPARLTDSFEARRHLAPPQKEGGQLLHGQTEFFEYHWSYRMVGNRLAHLLPTLRRLMVRLPHTVPAGLRVAWALLWLLTVVLVSVVVGIVRASGTEDLDLTTVVTALVGSGALAGVVLWLIKLVTGTVTQSFVDVVRYLDRSPRSYEVRRAIRTGMVDLLRALHEDQRYSRVVVVAHSLGAYIAYDGITALWPEMNKLHCSHPRAAAESLALNGLRDLEAAAHDVSTASGEARDAALVEFRQRQRSLWEGLRRQGNPWLITDFISVGTPMYFADILYTKDRVGFDRLVARAEMPTCPPQHEAQTAEQRVDEPARYGWPHKGRTVLGHAAPFAVVRWTNLWFPAKWSFFGDWFGGPLAPLLGPGIDDRPVLGNTPGRYLPGAAHSRYFSYPEATGEADVSTHLRDALELDWQADLEELLTAAPGFDERTRWTE